MIPSSWLILSRRTSFQRNTTEHFPFQEISLSTVGYRCDMSDWWLAFCVTERCLKPIVTHQKAFEFYSSISSHHLSNRGQYCVYLASIYGSRGTRSHWRGNGEFHSHAHKTETRKVWKAGCLRYKGLTWVINMDMTGSYFLRASSQAKAMSVCLLIV